MGPLSCPISLLCYAIKVSRTDSQHGFRKVRSTLSPYCHSPRNWQLASTKISPLCVRRTVAMDFDLSKAFNTVNHTNLMAPIGVINLHHNFVRCLTAYLRGRFASCRYKDVTLSCNVGLPRRPATSACHAVRAGIPQGSVFSPLFFDFFVSQHSQNWQFHSAYADDVFPAQLSTNVRTAARALTAHAKAVSEWAQEQGLQISAPSPTSLSSRPTPTDPNIENPTKLTTPDCH